MNFNHPPRKILITGKSGSGKTSLWTRTLCAWRCDYKFVFDPDCEFAVKSKNKAQTTIAGMVEAVKRKRPVVFDPAELFAGGFDEALDFFCRWVLTVSRVLSGQKLLAVDEIQKFTRTGRGGVPRSLQEILDVGRREELDLLLVAQQVNRVNDGIRCQLTELITFRHTDPLPLRWLSESGFDTDRVSKLKFPGGYESKKL